MNCPKCQKEIPDDSILCCYCEKRIVPKARRRMRVNGSGTAYKRGKTWTAAVVVGWRPEGKRLVPERRYKGGFKTKTDALEYCKALRNEKKKSRLTLERQYKAWESSLKFTKLSKSKQTAYKIAFAKLEAIKNTPIDEVRLEDIQPIIDSAGSYYPARDIRLSDRHDRQESRKKLR